MSNRLIAVMAKQIQQMAGASHALSDAVLLQRFFTSKDETAFAGLVRRHGPMVWAVCRNSLRSECDAEDAFQATFLSLVQNGQRIRTPASLGAYLHGVALRICLKARRRNARRTIHEAAAACAVNHTNRDDTWFDELSSVHERINRLPKSEHEIFVLCVLEGLSQAEVARRVGKKLNSVSGLLARARKRLQSQLGSKQGFSLLALSVVASAPSAVPAALLTQTYGLARSSVGVSLSILSLTASLTEVTMRKSIILMLLAVIVGSGVTFRTFLVETSDAQERASAAPFTQDARQQQNYVPASPSSTWAYTKSSAQKWEYKTIRRSSKDPVETELNVLGEEGWELCSTTSLPDTTQLLLVFKRPKQTKGVTLSEGHQNKNESQTAAASVSRQLLHEWVAGNTEYHVFHLQHANPMDVAESLKQIFKSSSVVCDPRSNTIHVQCVPKEADGIKGLIKKLDGGL